MVAIEDFCRPRQWPTISQSKLTPHGYPVYGANGQIGWYTSYNHEIETVLITCRGATCGTINVCPPRSYVTGNAMALDELDQTRVDLRYLVHTLTPDRLRRTITGSAQPQITRESLRGVSIPLPPIAEQRRIAAILDHADALVSSRRAVMGLLDSLSGSIFLDTFGDPVRATSTLDELAEVQIGPFGSLLHKEDYIKDGVPLINPMHITDGVICTDPNYTITPAKADSLTTYRLRSGDVIMGRRGEMGRCAVVCDDHDGYLCGTGSLIVRPRPERASARYLQAALSSRPMKALLESVALGATLPNLNATIVKRLPLLAPALSRQDQFIERVGHVDKYRAVSEHALSQALTLRHSLEYRAFSGGL